MCEEERENIFPEIVNEFSAIEKEDYNHEVSSSVDAVDGDSSSIEGAQTSQESSKETLKENESIKGLDGEEKEGYEHANDIAYWDNWKKYGFFTSLWETWRSVMFRTDRFFKSMPSPHIFNLFLYYFLFSLIGVNTGILPLVAALGVKKLSLGFIIFEFVFILVKFFLSAIILHFSIYIFGEPRGFRRTLQIVAYGSSTSVLLVIPLVGAILDFFYRIAIYVSGIYHSHKLSVASSVGAVLFPLFAIFFFMIIVMLMIIAIAGGTDVQKFQFFWKSFSNFTFLFG